MKHDAFLRGSINLTRPTAPYKRPSQRDGLRFAHSGSVTRRTNFWIPQVTLNKDHGAISDSTQLLLRAGYLRQAYSGIFHMLPLGLRVQQKLEALIDKHMTALGASKVSLSSISSQDLWQRSGRLSGGTEFFKFTDRKDSKWLLTPTHEEEITTLVAPLVTTPKDLPVRLYQISRKYRDERRPRGGLLRGREFVMKDLYTFDSTESEARSTYDHVRDAYADIFEELKVDYLSVQADSGNMGGTLSHEYHLVHESGEDILLRCTNCGFAKNEELVDEPVKCERKEVVGKGHGNESSKKNLIEYTTISKDCTALVKVYAPRLSGEADREAYREAINTHVLKAALGDLIIDTGVEDPEQRFLEHIKSKKGTIYYVFDSRIDHHQQFSVINGDYEFNRNRITTIHISPTSGNLDLLRVKTGDMCSSCSENTLTLHKAIEVGHTFHLGTRYSSKLGAQVPLDGNVVPLEMGCHGIGVSRLIAATAACLSDRKGLNWPKAIAPFQVAVFGRNPQERDETYMDFCEKLLEVNRDQVDVLLDDRVQIGLPWKMNDADLIGYPVVVVFGKAWDSESKVEIQCRRLKVKMNVGLEDAPGFVVDLLQQL